MSMLQTSKDDMQRELLEVCGLQRLYYSFKLVGAESQRGFIISFKRSTYQFFFQIMQFISAKKDMHSLIKNDMNIFEPGTMQP